MLVLSIRVPKRVHATGENYQRVLLEFPDGSTGVIHFFHSSGNHLKCGFEMPENVRVRRGSILDSVPPEKLAAFADGLSACVQAIEPVSETVRELHAAAVKPGRPGSFFPLTEDELSAAQTCERSR